MEPEEASGGRAWVKPTVILAVLALLVNAGFQVWDHAFAARHDPRYEAGTQKLDALDAKLGQARRWIEAHQANEHEVRWQTENLSVAEGLRHWAATELASGNFETADEYIVSANRLLDRILVDPIVYARYPNPGESFLAPPTYISFSYEVAAPITRVRLFVDGVEARQQAGVSSALLKWTPAAPLAEGEHTVRLVLVDASGWEASSEWGFTVLPAAPPQGEQDDSTWPPECGPSC